MTTVPDDKIHIPEARDISTATWGFCGLTAIMIVATWLVSGAYLRQAQEDAERIAASERSNVALALASQIETVVAQVDNSLLAMRHLWTDLGPDAFRQEDLERSAIQRRSMFYEQMALFNKDGDLIYTTPRGFLEQPLSAAGVEHFAVHRRDPPLDELHIGRPYFGRMAQRWHVQMTRPIFDRDGRFNGVIAASVRPEHFAALHRGISLGSGGVIAVLRDTGEYIARTVQHDETVGKKLDFVVQLSANAQSGELNYTPAVDGVTRVYTWRRAADTPLLLYAGQPTAAIAAPVNELRFRVYGWLGGFTALSVGSMAALVFAAGQKARARRALNDSEKRFRGMFESSNAAIAFIDLGGKFIDANDAFLKMTGRDLTELRGLTAAEISDPEDMRREDGLIKELIRGERKEYRLEKRCRLPSDETVWLDQCVSVIHADDGAPCLLVGVSYDISERKENEAALARSNADLEQFGYAASHDLRQPLRMIASYLTLLEKYFGDALGDEPREFLGYARDGARRMDQMLVSLLEYSRVGRLGEPMGRYDSKALLEEAILFLRPDIEASKAQINLYGDWPEIFVSRNEMVRLFQNLLSNAVKYRAPGRAPHIKVAVGPRNGQWIFSVSDDGVGMPPDQIGRLFNVFQRLTYRDEYEGCGVGLAVCRKIAERHGGRIWAETGGVGKGAIFRFSLPALSPSSVNAEVNSGDDAAAVV